MKIEFLRVGSSIAAPIPDELAEAIGADVGKSAEITIESNSIVIKVSPSPLRRRRYTLDELLKGMTPENVPDEIDWGAPRDGEAW
jgi:antitoxin MazE